MTRPLSVGIVCFPSLGGSGVVAAAQAVGLAERGHEVHLVARSAPPRALPLPRGLTFHPVELPPYPLFESPPYTVALASKLIDVAREHRLDLLHVHYAVPHAVSAYLARQALGAQAPRVITSLHGTDVTRVGCDPAYRSATVFSVAASDGLVVPSVFLQREAHRLLGLPEAMPVEVIPNFVDTERFSPAPDPAPPGGAPVLFHVSNFRAVKRVPDTVEVLARVRKHLPATLVLVGDGPERRATDLRARALGVERWVRFAGRQEDFVGELRRASAFLVPSESESFGVAALEALSAGVPVFGYRVGGLPELVTPDVGRLVEPLDVDALASAVVEVLGDAPLHASLRKAGRERALAHFRAAPAIDRYESYLRRILTLTPSRESR
ncbi:MAG TPA: N-acetyl-alpha-D-glucosaminyl L-malate synthase BshA [Longimicrobium sp.]|nr:N-acetyl-alpha-D-glucosaminyl L-malate synthase BshA [Longimicrobium sp.]